MKIHNPWSAEQYVLRACLIRRPRPSDHFYDEFSMTLFSNISVQWDEDSILSDVRLDRESAYAKELIEFIEHAKTVAAPKAAYLSALPQKTSDTTLDVDGVIFESRTLVSQIDFSKPFFPFIATCGRELDQHLCPEPDDILKIFWLDTIKERILRQCTAYLKKQLIQNENHPKLACINPGSGHEHMWPIEQQRQLFQLFGDTETLLGVRLTDSFLMIPNKSVSGVFFPTERTYENCQLCPRENCPNRRAKFDEKAFEDNLYNMDPDSDSKEPGHGTE